MKQYPLKKNDLITLEITDLTPEARKVLNIPEGRTLESLQAELQAQAQQTQAATAQ